MKLSVLEVVDRFLAYHDAHGGWGEHFHVVLEDGNFENSHAQGTLEEVVSEGADPEVIALARLLVQMSPTQRSKIAHAKEYPPGQKGAKAARRQSQEYWANVKRARGTGPAKER